MAAQLQVLERLARREVIGEQQVRQSRIVWSVNCSRRRQRGCGAWARLYPVKWFSCIRRRRGATLITVLRDCRKVSRSWSIVAAATITSGHVSDCSGAGLKLKDGRSGHRHVNFVLTIRRYCTSERSCRRIQCVSRPLNEGYCRYTILEPSILIGSEPPATEFGLHKLMQID